MAEAAKVRVGVRVRPLLPRETAQEVSTVITHPSEKQVLVDNNAAHLFTYDHVFPMHASQRDLYASTAAQMLQPFLDGYNVTVLAYGQTGSGKTYTMGSECGTTDKYDDDRRGLIPRFLYDMFMNLDGDVPQRLGANATASFLEIYGEDVYDLLGDAHAPGTKRTSLQVLEDKGGVFVNGLTQVPVLGWEAALDVLSQGVLSRTTASTLMNTVSSRSHAVFTITLAQTMRDDADPDGEPQTVTSKLTFVDLAGSERLGRTGAEGQRKREGIQINQGLLALGNVINALGDDRVEKKSAYVPYRQSKLTRLLQDALGGNSQTLFIACVSPAADSINETVGALHYANRARNIKNKVVKNTDGIKEELRRLRSTAAALQLELVREHFGLGDIGVDGDSSEGGNPEATGGPAGLGLGPSLQAEDVLGRDDVKAYLRSIQMKVSDLLRKRQDRGAVPLLVSPGLTDPEASSLSVSCSSPLGPAGNLVVPGSAAGAEGRSAWGRRVLCETRGGRQGAECTQRLTSEDVLKDELGGVIDGDGGPDADEALDHDPEEELAVLDQLIEWQRQSGEYGDAAKEEERRLEETDAQIREKESMLLKVRETLQGYHHMRERFEVLVGKMGELEKEKASLIATMNREAAAASTASSESSTESGRPRKPSATVEALREKLKGVESQLASLGAQKKKQERAVMLLQRESKKCYELQDGLASLKRQKVMLLKRQQEAAKRHREYEQRMSREIQAMRKKNNRDLKHMSKMELEVRRQKAAVARKDTQVGRIGDRLKKAEEHLLRLLSLRSQQKAAERARMRVGVRRGATTSLLTPSAGDKSRSKGAPGAGGEGGARAGRETPAGAETSEARVAAVKHLLEQAVNSKVEQAALRQAFAAKIRSYDEHTSSQVANIGMLRDYRGQLKELKALATAAANSAGALVDGKRTGGAGSENVDPSGRSGVNGVRFPPNGVPDGPGGGGGAGRKPSVGDVDTIEGQRAVLEALVQETEKAVDETQQQLELLGGELDDMCRRLGMGDNFQGRSAVSKADICSPSDSVAESGDKGVESPVGGGGGGVLASREFRAVEALNPREIRLLITSLMDDITSSGIGDMLRLQEADKQAAEMLELREKNKTMKDELFRLSQRYTRRMSQMKVDHTRDMVRLSMLDSVEDSTEDGSGLGSLSGPLPEGNDSECEAAVTGTPMAAAMTPSGAEGPLERTPGLGRVATNLFSSPVPTRASWGGPRTSPRTGAPPMVPSSPISSRDACEASANRRLSGQHMDVMLARQRQLEASAETEKKRFEKVVDRNRSLTLDLQRERAERQRLQARLAVAERGVEGARAESLSDLMAALEDTWTQLGVTSEQRMGLMDQVSHGVVREAESLLGKARDESLSLNAKVGSLREDLHGLWMMLGKTQEDEAGTLSGFAGKPLRTQADILSKLVVAASDEVVVGASRRAKLRSAATAAVRVLELPDTEVGPHLRTLLSQARFTLPRALKDDEVMTELCLGDPSIDNDARNPYADRRDVEDGRGGSWTDDQPYLVGSTQLEQFEGEVRKLRTMQAEALASYHQVRDEAREAVLSMDLSVEHAYELCRRSADEGWVELYNEQGEVAHDLDEDALDYACGLLCNPETTHAHVSRSRTLHLQMAWSAVKLAYERRKSLITDAQALVERAHQDLVSAAASSGSAPGASPAPASTVEAEEDAPERSRQVVAASPSPALEAFLERLSEDFPPLSMGVLEACKGELVRLRHESTTACERARERIAACQETLQETLGPCAENVASQLPSLPSSAVGGKEGEAAAAAAAAERLKPGENPGAEEWVDEAAFNVANAWEAARESIGSFALSASWARVLERRVAALEGVRSSDQDICQLAQRMAELQATLEPGRLSKRSKPSTHLLDAEKNRNAYQAAYMRALKRLKEQLRSWREATGCGFDPSLLSDVAREALIDLQRGGRSGAKIEHILPHLESGAGAYFGPSGTGSGSAVNSASGSRTVSPEMKSKPRLSGDQSSVSGRGAGMSSGSSPSAAVGSATLKQQQQQQQQQQGGGRSPEQAEGSGGDTEYAGSGWAGNGGGVLTSIADPGLVASSSITGLPVSKGTAVGAGSGSVNSFRGRGGAFGMLLHKVQAGQPAKSSPAMLTASSLPADDAEPGDNDGVGEGGMP